MFSMGLRDAESHSGDFGPAWSRDLGGSEMVSLKNKFLGLMLLPPKLRFRLTRKFFLEVVGVLSS